MRLWLLASLLSLGIAGSLPAQTQPLLQLQGQPYFGGSMTLHLTGAIGQPALLAYGLNPLTTPVQTGKGPWFIGSMMNLIALGNIPSEGLINLSFMMPSAMPALSGIPIVMQAYVPSQLSNPATLPLDEPYLLPSDAVRIQSPEPQVQALFGDRVAVGDLNADGESDIIVGAWFQDVAGVDKAGSVFVLWGPAFSAYTKLEPVVPRANGDFGESLIIADLDNDRIDDLVIGETTGSLAPQNVHGQLHVYWGGAAFSNQVGLDIQSIGAGVEFSDFGRRVTHGDYNGDGWIDLVVGNDLLTVGGMAQAGRVDVYWGPGFASHAELFSPDSGPNAYFGSALATADLNGDGTDDLIEGSGRDDVGSTTNLGTVHLFLGPSLQWFKTLTAPINGGINTRFGEAVSALEAEAHAFVVASSLLNQVYLIDPLESSPLRIISKPPVNGAPPSTETYFGESYVATADVNDDMGMDIAIPDGDGVLQGCGLLGPEGQLYIALYPYYATFFVSNEPTPNCGDGFASSLAISVPALGGGWGVIGAPTFDVPGNMNAGALWLIQP